MAGQITQLAAIQEVNEIQNAATRTLQSTTNSFGSIMADLNTFSATTQPAAGFDAATTAEIEAIKTQLITTAIATLNGMITQLQNV